MKYPLKQGLLHGSFLFNTKIVWKSLKNEVFGRSGEKNMAYSDDFTDYNRRYLELKHIFEFLFPISRNGKNLIPRVGLRNHNVYTFKKIIDEEINECISFFRDEGMQGESPFELVMSDHILSPKKGRSFIEHNSYKINNERWYNLIFTMYRIDPKKEKHYEEFRTYANKLGNKYFFQSFEELFKSADICAYFAIMDKIMPFSTIGFWLYLRICKNVDEVLPMIFHGQNPCLGGLQDILYQISFAIQIGEEKNIYINNIGPFKFKGIIYEDTSLMQKENNPYIIASANYQGVDRDFKIYIQGDMDLKIKNEGNTFKTHNLDYAESKKTVKILHYKNIYTYNLYLISNKKDIINNYLLAKVEREGKWFDENAYKTGKKLKGKLEYDFKYYNYGQEWDVFLFKFTIAEKERDSFERWADSFGNFAIWELNRNKESYLENEELYLYFLINTSTRARNIENDIEGNFPTLLMNENYYGTLYSHKKSVSVLELNWLLYAMTKYPNFSKVFLCATKTNKDGELNLDMAGHNITDGITCVKKYIETEPKYAEDNPFKVLNDMAVQDLSINHCVKFHAIIQGIKNKNYYQCGKQEKSISEKDNQNHNAILPYAVNFDTINYNPDNGKGITVMAYDLVQKRVVAVPFKNFTYKKSEGGSDGIIEYKYAEYDKLYYFSSYFYKLYKTDKETACFLARLITGEEFPNDVYNKRIPDNLKKTVLFKNSINPWINYMKNSSMDLEHVLCKSNDLKYNGISLFTEKEIQYKEMVGKTISYFLGYKEKLYLFITDDICKNFISGNTKDTIIDFIYNIELDNYDITDVVSKIEILNEIQYTNSVLKIHELVFCLKNTNPDLDDIILVYDHFRNYNCAGYKIDGKYYFKIQFERFEYRKIQEIALALSSIIDIPEETVSFNKSEYHKKQSIAYIEQQSQSRLLRYRSIEGKEKLKEKLEKFLQDSE